MNLIKAIRGKFLKTFVRSSQDAQTSILKKEPFQEKITKHRNFLSIYDLRPAILLNSYLAPNSTLIGEVVVGNESSVWHNVVIRGDLNSVWVGNMTSIGDNTIIHTAGSLPNGMPASVTIGNGVIIQSGSTIYSAIIEDECLIGFRSIILEGSRLERGCVIGPNSVVPPGRIIPSYQLWAGNPVEYVRDLTKQEKVFMIHYPKLQLSLNWAHKYQFLPYSSAYLLKENTEEEISPLDETYRDASFEHEFGNSTKALNNIYN